MKISISALSIAYGLSSEALRYYEEKGLLTPERTSSSGFRKFSMEDVQRVGIIKSLQRQGFSLDEIKHIMSACSLSELISLMDEKRAQLAEQITLSLSIRSRLNQTTDLLRDSQSLNMKPRLCPGCAAYLIDFDSVEELWRDVPKNDLLKPLIDALPLTSYCTTIPLSHLEGQNTPLRKGICAPAEYAAVINADFSRMRMSAGPRSVRVLFELVLPNQRTLEPVIDCARSFIREQKLTPIADGYTRQYIWFTDENSNKRQYSELIIPVM